MGTYWQIPVKIHWSFALLLLFVIFTAFSNGLKTSQSVGFIFFVIILFICVVLHEYGHALTARKYGVKTRDIMLSPIGGLARLENMPEKPKHEFFIAFAGPFVNLTIGTMGAIIMFLSTGKVLPDLNAFGFDDISEFLRYIIWMNFALFFFNLIPAFPMDGGRILRALLASKLGRLRATLIAVRIGRIIAIGFVVFGILNQQLILSLAGLFIYMMAGQEYSQIKALAILSHTKVKEIMRTSFTVLQKHDSFSTVLEKYYQESEQNFLVFDSSGHPCGAVSEQNIKKFTKENNPQLPVEQFMVRDAKIVSSDATIKDVLEQMNAEGLAIVAISDENEITGVLDRNNIENFIRLKM